MKAVCIRTFMDVETGELREEGTRFDTTPERLSAINSTKYGQLAQEVVESPSEETTEPQTDEKPKPKRRGRRPKSTQE